MLVVNKVSIDTHLALSFVIPVKISVPVGMAWCSFFSARRITFLGSALGVCIFFWEGVTFFFSSVTLAFTNMPMWNCISLKMLRSMMALAQAAYT